MDQVRIDPAWALRMPAALALRRQVLPFASVGGQVYVACLDLADSAALEAVERYVRLPDLPAAGRSGLAAAGVEPDFRQAMRGLCRRMPRTRPDEADGAADPRRRRGRGPVRRADARRHRAPGLRHPYRPGRKATCMSASRGRGAGAVPRSFPIAVHNGVISRFKVLGGMDIAEKRAPQDGRFTHRLRPGRHRPSTSAWPPCRPSTASA